MKKLADWRTKHKEKLAKALLSEPTQTTIGRPIKPTGVVLIMGDRRSGKSVTAFSIMEYFHDKKGINGAVCYPQMNKKLRRLQIAHTIAHELAHKVTYMDATQLHEKAAEELLIKWGFGEESEAVKYDRPISESEGFRIGSDWAREQDDLSRFDEFYDEWNEGRLSDRRTDELIDMTNIMSILDDRGLRNPESEETTVSQANQPLDQGGVDKGIIWGIMSVLRERKTKAAVPKALKETARAEFEEHLERINSELDKLARLVDYCPAGRDRAIELVTAVVVTLRELEKGNKRGPRSISIPPL